jgi:hypothetical protein
MRFKMGIAMGFAAGYWWASIPPDQRRAKVDELWSDVRGHPRVQRVTDTVTTDAKRLGDAVEQRLTSTADSAVEKVAKVTEPDQTSSSNASSKPSQSKSA